MSLTGTPVLILSVLSAVIAPGLTAFVWSRVRGQAALRWTQRIAMVVVSQLCAVAMAGILVNNEFSLYDSWSDLLGSNPVAATGPVPDGDTPSGGGTSHLGGSAPSVDIPGLRPLPAAQPGSGGRLIEEEVEGPASRIRAKVWILLPAGYNLPQNAQKRYPVVQFLPGYPGTPTTWLHALQLQQVADTEVAAGRVKPFIAVLPTMNVAMPRDTECTDIPNGPQVATWLGSDVPRIVAQQTRTLPLGTWGITGYSTGGFCTAKLTLMFPKTFHAGAVLAGYFTTGTDSTTGDLFGGSQTLQDANDPTWLVSRQTPPAVHLLTVYSAGDPATNQPTQRFLAAVRPPLQVDQIKLTAGGHNTGVWLSVEPQVLAWLSRMLG
ncbi:MAG TPA: alpha/beta hydrolase-fold protein [Kineosporiaceae bacterium]|nr:alpha/beta hydrolase-fold protein [Kineosporiaceae bacterium]